MRPTSCLGGCLFIEGKLTHCGGVRDSRCRPEPVIALAAQARIPALPEREDRLLAAWYRSFQ
jgi:hypothetical protein